MSFRARSRTTQPLPSRHRSLSSSRVQNAGSTYSNYNGTTYNSSNLRPLSTGSGYYQNNSGKSSSTSGGNGSTSSYLYQSPYTSSNIYNSRDNLYSISATRNGGGSVGGSYNNAYSNVTNNDHRYDHRSYTSPYVSSYDHGITTASLSFNMGPTTKNVGSSNITTNCSTPSSTLAKSNSFRGSNSYLNTTNKNNNNAISMANARSLHKAKSLSQSSSSLNMYHMGTGSMGVASATAIAAITSRSNSLREQERKSRTRSRSRSAAQRSLSASSEKSEGYESGSEQKHSTRSRLETTSSSTAASSTTATSSTSSTSTSSATYDKKSREKTDNDDNIDYKALWEAVKLENEKLKQQLKKKDDEITQTRTTLERFANTNAKSSLSENEKRERRAMERKLSELEEELKQLQKLKSENERLRAENRALTRVVSKLTTSAQCQLSKSKQ